MMALPSSHGLIHSQPRLEAVPSKEISGYTLVGGGAGAIQLVCSSTLRTLASCFFCASPDLLTLSTSDLRKQVSCVRSWCSSLACSLPGRRSTPPHAIGKNGVQLFDAMRLAERRPSPSSAPGISVTRSNFELMRPARTKLWLTAVIFAPRARLHGTETWELLWREVPCRSAAPRRQQLQLFAGAA